MWSLIPDVTILPYLVWAVACIINISSNGMHNIVLTALNSSFHRLAESRKRLPPGLGTFGDVS
uniref:Uncharacterized protein n=1 Tax=Sinocyclocheilus rhinocerous TaxID=307959 RepID=A0A673GSK6_9TELE